MQTFFIKKNNQLTHQEWHDLILLANICRRFDGVMSKLYWEALNHRREVAGNFFYYQATELIGYLSFFLFEEKTAYISSIVHPTYRRQKIFSRLLKAAIVEMLKLNVVKLIFPFPIQNNASRQCLLSLSGQFQYIEYHMDRLTPQFEVKPQSRLLIKKARNDDVACMAKMDAICFGGDYSSMLQRFKETICDNDREVWIAYLNDQGIGKCHVQLQSGSAFIYDLCILPTYQQNGYGTDLLRFLINHLISINFCYHMSLEVMTNNESALTLYKNCHFIVMNTFEYWQVELYSKNNRILI